ncbi:MAG: transposase [Burkholderiales bacterium]|nr:transposase [Burkholderiales bacterium]
MHTTEADLRDGRHRRRRHSEEFKAQVVAECARPGVSIAAIALHHGLNANLLRRWVAQGGVSDAREPRQERPTSTALEAFVPVTIAADAVSLTPQPAAIEVEIKRGVMSVRINWPLSASAQCGAWLRELLR